MNKLARTVYFNLKNDCGTQTSRNTRHKETQTEDGFLEEEQMIDVIIDDKKFTKCKLRLQYNSYLLKHLREAHNCQPHEIAAIAKHVKPHDNRSGHTGVDKTKECPVE